MRIKGEEMVRARIAVRGVVQGVGFRPFIHRLAKEHHLKGWVLNSTEGVVIEVEGDEERIEGFIADMVAEPPPLAVIERVDKEFLPPVGYTSFLIRESARVEGRFALVSPDISICQDCLRELFNPQDRRYRYPFINCTNCGPRFTIIEDIPYDRPMTTMRAFPMCPSCEVEYNDPADRRFHAQPNACPECGPRVWLQSADCNSQSAEPIAAARELLAAGHIVAVKGLGGFHLACDATNDAAVRTLRERKQRVDKPFAIMSYDAAMVERYCYLSQAERQLLESRERPIVLLRRRPDSPISELVAPNNNYLGVMLPYTPLHYLLLSPQGSDGSPLALVMTSGNVKEEPIATGNEEALECLAPLADYFLLHDREIRIRCDDSVTRVFEGQEMPLRRSRGYAPFPIRLLFELEEILACGAELKNTFCLTKEGYAFLSQHIGDLENFETLASYEASIEHFKRLFRVNPRVIAYDMHPDYLATKYAQSQIANCELQVAVQHHHAHIASCMAEHGLKERVIGVAFDGTGYGADGRIWGGEFLVADYGGFERAGHLAYVPMPGGEAAIKKPYRMALSHLHRAYGSLRAEPPRPELGAKAQGEALELDLPLLRRVDPVELKVIEHQIETGLNSPLTSSTGRLFDAVSALIGVRDVVNYEAQAAIELEMIAAEDVEEGYTLRAEPPRPELGAKAQGEAIHLSPTPYPLILDPAPLIRAIVADIKRGVDRSVISAKFHNAVAAMVLDVCGIIREREGLNKVVLSGGVFQNVYLLRRSLHLLRRAGFEVYIHRLVPCNDGGISLGQALVANTQWGRRS